MKTGNIESDSIDGLMQVVYDSGELAAAVTSVTISGLDGDTDGEYELIVRCVNTLDAADATILLRPNNDTGNNYGYQYLLGENATASAVRDTSEAGARITACGFSGNLSFSVSKIKAKSGYVRTIITKDAEYIATTTVADIFLWGHSWNNTADNITSLVLTASQTDGIGIGSRIILLRKVSATDGLKTGELDVQGVVKYAWQEIYNTTLAAAATSVTISGLTGNTDVLYRVRARIKNGYDGGCSYGIRPNNASGGSDYGYQYIDGANTTVAAERNTLGYLQTGYIDAINSYCYSNTLLYAKSGFVRTGIAEYLYNTATTTVGGIHLNGTSWNETPTEITSLVILAEQADGLGIGTEIVLERLNL